MDRYAGWLGTIAARHEGEGGVSPSVSLNESGHRLAAVAGTSTCHLVQVQRHGNLCHGGHRFLNSCSHRRARKGSLLEVFGVHTKQAILTEYSVSSN
jgi:hypothetical protein